MIKKFIESLKEFKEANFSFRDIVIYVFIISVTLAGYYGYRLISSLEFKYQKLEQATERTISDLFSTQIGVPYSAIQEPVRDAGVLYKERVQADWVILLGVHNGDVFGPFHLKKLSLVEEIKSEGLESQLSRFQSIPVNLYENFEIFKTNPDTVLVSDFSSLSSRSKFRYPALGWREYGIQSYAATSVYETQSTGEGKLVGVVGFYYRRGTTPFLKENKRFVTQQIKQFKELVESEIQLALYPQSQNSESE